MSEHNLDSARHLRNAIVELASELGIKITGFSVDVTGEEDAINVAFEIDSNKLAPNADQEEINSLFNDLVKDIIPTASPKMDMFEEFLEDEEDDL